MSLLSTSQPWGSLGPCPFSATAALADPREGRWPFRTVAVFLFNKAPQTQRLQHQKWILLQAGGWTSNIMVWQGWFLLEGGSAQASPASWRCGINLGIAWLVDSSPHLCDPCRMAFSPCLRLWVQISPFNKDTSQTGHGPPCQPLLN